MNTTAKDIIMNTIRDLCHLNILTRSDAARGLWSFSRQYRATKTYVAKAELCEEWIYKLEHYRKNARRYAIEQIALEYAEARTKDDLELRYPAATEGDPTLSREQLLKGIN